MSYQRVEFALNIPIEGDVGSVPDGIELKKDNGIITELWVLIGEDIEDKIERSERFKTLFAETEAKNKKLEETGSANSIVNETRYVVVKEYAIRKAQNYLARLNFIRGSHKYEIKNCSLVTLLPTGQLQYTREVMCGVGGTIGNDFGMDVSRTYDEDEILNKLYYNYDMGMKAQQEGNLVSAFQCFYSILPVRRGSTYTITDDAAVNAELKIIRDGISHDILTSKNNVELAKTLFGQEYVLRDGASSKSYAVFDPSNPRHMDLIRKDLHIVRNRAREYIDQYITSGGIIP